MYTVGYRVIMGFEYECNHGDRIISALHHTLYIYAFRSHVQCLVQYYLFHGCYNLSNQIAHSEVYK